MTALLFVGPNVWMCVHNEQADECLLCDDEDQAINGARESYQCEHGLVDADGVCLDCREMVEE